jgi:hypothetical protein
MLNLEILIVELVSDFYGVRISLRIMFSGYFSYFSDVMLTAKFRDLNWEFSLRVLGKADHLDDANWLFQFFAGYVLGSCIEA